MSEPTATELQILRAENSALHSRAEMDRIDYLAAVRRAELAEAKLMDYRVFVNALRLKHDLDVPEEIWKELELPTEPKPAK